MYTFYNTRIQVLQTLDTTQNVVCGESGMDSHVTLAINMKPEAGIQWETFIRMNGMPPWSVISSFLTPSMFKPTQVRLGLWMFVWECFWSETK